MNLEDYYYLPILVAFIVICASIFISEFEIQDDEIDSFVSRANDLKEQTQDVGNVFSAKTTEKGLSGIIEEIPIFGESVKIVKFLSSIVSVLRSGVDLMIGLFSDMLKSNVLGIDGRIIALVLASLFGAFGFAVFKAIKTGN